MATIEELQQNITELSRRLEEKEKHDKERDGKIELLEHKPLQLDRYLDNTSKDIIEDIINERFINILFDNIYYYNSWMDSVDGLESVGVNFTAAGILALETAGTGTDESYIAKVNPVIINSLDFTKESRFRVNLSPRHSTNQNIKAVVGDTNSHSYGFQIEDDILSGYTTGASGTSTISLNTTITATNNYRLEARFFPGERVDFFVNGVNFASLTTNLPTNMVTAEILWSVSITEQAASIKRLHLASIEYIQTIN